MVRDFREATIADIFDALNLPERGKIFRDIPEDLVPGAQAHVNALNQYVEEVEDFFDEKARRFKDILWNVWAVEDTYAQKLRGIREKLEREKQLTDLFTAYSFGNRFGGILETLGLTSSLLAVGRTKLGEIFRGEEQTVALAKEQYAEVLGLLAAAGATQVENITTISDVSRLMVDLDNYNNRSTTTTPITAPKLGVTDNLAIKLQVAIFRYKVAEMQDPFIDVTNPDEFNDSYYITSCYGKRDIGYGPEWHGGVDLAGGYKGNPIAGQEIVSHVRAEVMEVAGGTNTGVGYYVILKVECPDEFSPNETVTRYYHYYHMEAPSALQPGDIIEPGTTIGAVGNTGTYKMPPHLHFEVQTDYVQQGETVVTSTNTIGREAHTINPSFHLNNEYDHGTVTKEAYENAPDGSPGYDSRWNTPGGPPPEWTPPDGANWPDVDDVGGGILAPWDCVGFDSVREQQLMEDPEAMIEV